MSGYRLQENAPLRSRNTFRVAARARLFVEVLRAEALAEVFAFPMLRQAPVLVLGEGSNLLLVGDVDGVVVAPAMQAIDVVQDTGGDIVLRAEAGVNWDDFVRHSLGLGLCGLENLSLIPGTVGAAPIQNIGAYGVEVGEHIAWVEAFDRDSAAFRRIPVEDCGFGYRDSRFKREAGRWVVTSVGFRLSRTPRLRTGYAGIAAELQAMGVEDPRPSQVAEAVIRLRTRKLPNPALVGNAGSFFKNPVVDDATAEALAGDHPDLPRFPAGEAGRSKLSAAWLIEACGWKGHREGDAGVSGQHALVLVNHGEASGRELLDLAQRVAGAVQARFGIALEPEPRIIGADFGPTPP